MRASRLFGLFALGSLLTLPATAAIVAVTNLSGGNINPNDTPNRTIGWAFSTNSDIFVQSLGVWDAGNDGLLIPHMVGLWTTDAVPTLLASVEVQAGTASAARGPLIQGGQARFESISPLFLAAGQSFIIGARYDTSDPFISFADSITTASEITWINERFASSTTPGFVVPALDDHGEINPGLI